jgi:hypothetical protein
LPNDFPHFPPAVCQTKPVVDPFQIAQQGHVWQIWPMKTLLHFHRSLMLTLSARLLSIIIVFCAISPFARAATAMRPNQSEVSASQQFVCNAGYDRNQCDQQIAQLKALLTHYPAGILDRWTWILVRSEDWQPFLQRLRLDRRSPAITAPEEHETFLEQALFLPHSKRADELIRHFHLPISQLLDLAVRHEMGHAICHGGDESAANKIAVQLLNGKHPDCNPAEKGVSRVDEMYLTHTLAGLPLHHP